MLPDSRRLFPATDQTISEAASLLRAGELVAFPTETVYGLGANAYDDEAVGKIFSLKGRPSTNPLIVHVHELAAISSVIATQALIDKEMLLRKLTSFWPGPLTVVLPKNPAISNLVTAGKDSVGVRIPRHPVALELLRQAGVPIAAPSANRSNYVSPTCAQHVIDSFGAEAPFTLDAGKTEIGVETTVISLLDQVPTNLRPGGISLEELEQRLGRVEIAKDLQPVTDSQISPGQLREHYSPRTRLVFLIDSPDLNFPQRTGLIAFSKQTAARFAHCSEIRLLSQNGDLSEIAAGIFSSLRDLDQLELDLIAVDSCPEIGLGRAIMDRLRRAVAKFSPEK